MQIVKDRQTGKSRGFCFVTFEDQYVVEEVLSVPHNIQGKMVFFYYLITYFVG